LRNGYEYGKHQEEEPMLNQPDREDQVPAKSGKLVLPAPVPNEPGAPEPPETPGTVPVTRPLSPPAGAGNFKERISPAQLMRPLGGPPPRGLFARLVFYWRKDPAYKVFMLAVAMVVVASIIFVSMAGAALFNNPFGSSSSTQSPPAAPTTTGAVDLKPTFAPPGGGKGSNQSSQPPAQAQSTPELGTTPTPTATATTPAQGGTLQVQITSYPPIVSDFSRVSIVVSTNEPGVEVILEMRSDGTPRNSTAGPGVTDDSGTVTIPWYVSYFGGGRRFITVNITAVATDQNGQRAYSAPVTVQVFLQGLP
jgi:hypothetical protein